MRRSTVPPFVVALLCIDVVLATAYLVNVTMGAPIRPLNAFIDLDRENNLPTWYSSVKWFGAAMLMGLSAHRVVRVAARWTWPVLALPLMCVALSLDEVVELHEFAGKMSDGLLPGGRANTALPQTGIWVLLIGIPFILALTAVLTNLRSCFRHAPAAFQWIIAGMAVMLTGALAVETLANFVAPGSWTASLQVFGEELLEMAGASLVVWGGYDWLTGYGFRFSFDGSLSSWPAGARHPRLARR